MSYTHASHLIHGPKLTLIKLRIQKTGIKIVAFDNKDGDRDIVQGIGGYWGGKLGVAS